MKKLLALLALIPTFALAQYTAVPAGFYWPYQGVMTTVAGTVGTMDAATEKFSMCGAVYWNGRPASKTIDNSANSKIAFAAGAVTFANAGTTIDLGFQAASSSGPMLQPSGTFLGGTPVKRTLTGGTDTITANVWNEYALTTAGTSFTLAQGDLTCIVLDMTGRGGADSVTVNTITGAPIITGVPMLPVTNAYVAAAWQSAVGVGAGLVPLVVFTANDGTIGTLGPMPANGFVGNTTWTDATNPDERGMIFQVPFGAKVDALWMNIRTVDATSDFTINLWSDCEGTPTSLASITVDAAQLGVAATDGVYISTIASEVTLTANTDYCVSVKATGAGNIRQNNFTIASAAARAFMPGSTTMRSVTRNGGSGAFGSSSTTLMLPMGVRISAVSGGGSGGGVY